MCSVSLVIAYGQRIPYTDWNKPLLTEFEKLVKSAEEFDKATGQPDCVDPQKELWLAAIKQYIDYKKLWEF